MLPLFLAAVTQMLDVIVTVSESTPKAFVNECLHSVHAAADRCPYPVNVIEVPGVPGHIGRAMERGYQRSGARYVAWVDDDDFVLPNAFSCLERHFAAGWAAIHAREIHLLANGRLIPADRRHHLTAYRRDAIPVATFESRSRPNVHMIEAVAASAVDELSWVYVYRIRRSEASKLRAAA